MADPLPTSVGFVGLGRMGTPMVRRLAAAGIAVRAYDTVARPDLTEVVTLVDRAPAVADDIVILMLPDSAAVEAVAHGSGLLEALARGTVLIDMGSSEPVRTRALADRAAERGVVVVDAPVSGGVAGATAGTMAIMLGGPDGIAATLGPLLGVLGRPRHVGPVGAGHALKALNNLMSATHLLASSEALLVGQRFGLDPTVMLEAVNGSSGRSVSTEVKWPNFVVPGTFDSGFAIALMLKDIRIALDLARVTGASAALATRTVELWTEATEALGPAADQTEIVRWLQEVAGS